MGALPVSSPAIELGSPTVTSVDTLICGGSETTYSGRQLFSIPATATESDVSMLDPDADVIKELSVKVFLEKKEKTYPYLQCQCSRSFLHRIDEEVFRTHLRLARPTRVWVLHKEGVAEGG